MPVGFGVSGSTAVVFLGVLIASGTLYTAAAGSAEQLSDARSAESEELLDRRNTVINVASVTYNTNTSTLTVTATNNGTTALSVADTSLLVDNEFAIPDSTAVDDDTATDVWAPDQSLVVTVDADTAPALDATTPDRVKVVAENGVAASNTTVEEVG